MQEIGRVYTTDFSSGASKQGTTQVCKTSYKSTEVLVFTVGRGQIAYEWDPIPQMGKFSFKIKSNPLASNMGNHSVGK